MLSGQGVVAVFVVMRVFERVGQILLPHPVAGIIMRVFVPLLALKARAVGVDILHLARDVAALPGAHCWDC